MSSLEWPSSSSDDDEVGAAADEGGGEGCGRWFGRPGQALSAIWRKMPLAPRVVRRPPRLLSRLCAHCEAVLKFVRILLEAFRFAPVDTTVTPAVVQCRAQALVALSNVFRSPPNLTLNDSASPTTRSYVQLYLKPARFLLLTKSSECSANRHHHLA